MKAWINGIGWVTPAGFGQGNQAMEQPFCFGELEIPTRKQVFNKADMRFGRLDEFSRVGLAAIAFCLRDARRDEWEAKRPIGIIAASHYGCLQTDLAYLETMLPGQGRLASPNLFVYTLPNCFLGEAALRFGLTGNSLVMNQADGTGLAVLAYALEDLCWSGQQGMLTGLCDLQPPAGMEDGVLPGGLFLLLEKEQQEHGSYGELTLSGEQLAFNGAEVASLQELVSACLAARS